jgi:hypothetical protein
MDPMIRWITRSQQQTGWVGKRVLLSFMEPERLSHSVLPMTTAARLAPITGMMLYPAALEGWCTIVQTCARLGDKTICRSGYAAHAGGTKLYQRALRVRARHRNRFWEPDPLVLERNPESLRPRAGGT